MTRCREVARWATRFADGDLDPERSSAVRGHARHCSACRELLADEARLRQLAAELEPVDPPPSLWRRIEDELAREEVADAARSGLWLWWQGARGRIASAGLVAAAVAALVFFWQVQKRTRPVAAPQLASATAADANEHTAAEPAIDHAARLRREIARAEARYRETVSELEELLAEERPAWAAQYAARVDARAAELAAEIDRLRQGDLGADQPAENDPLFAAYHRQISFLQDVALGEAEL